MLGAAFMAAVIGCGNPPRSGPAGVVIAGPLIGVPFADTSPLSRYLTPDWTPNTKDAAAIDACKTAAGRAGADPVAAAARARFQTTYTVIELRGDHVWFEGAEIASGEPSDRPGALGDRLVSLRELREEAGGCWEQPARALVAPGQATSFGALVDVVWAVGRAGFGADLLVAGERPFAPQVARVRQVPATPLSGACQDELVVVVHASGDVELLDSGKWRTGAPFRLPGAGGAVDAAGIEAGLRDRLGPPERQEAEVRLTCVAEREAKATQWLIAELAAVSAFDGPVVMGQAVGGDASVSEQVPVPLVYAVEAAVPLRIAPDATVGVVPLPFPYWSDTPDGHTCTDEHGHEHAGGSGDLLGDPDAGSLDDLLAGLGAPDLPGSAGWTERRVRFSNVKGRVQLDEHELEEGLLSCFRAAVDGKPGVEGTITLAWGTDTGGKPAARLVSNRTRSPALGECALARANALHERAMADDVGSVLTVTFRTAPGGAR